MPKISKIVAREILDSRGRPTIEADVILDNGVFGRAAVPSGASTGSMEAIELRDGDAKRFLGNGVLKAIANIHNILAPNLVGKSPFEQEQIDQIMIDLDGTDNKANLGANAILAVSLAVAKAAANAKNLPFFRYLNANKDDYKLPYLFMNIINGGAHADNSIEIQEFMIMPNINSSVKEAIRMGAEIFHALKNILQSKGYSTNVGDEGGFAPNLNNADEAIEYIMLATAKAGYKIGQDVMLALDCAASEFYQNNLYNINQKKLTSAELIAYYQELANKYAINYIEDPMAENDFSGWQFITEKLSDKLMLVGDDLFVTNQKNLELGIAQKMANAILIKPNQIGTLSETMAAINCANRAGYKAIISHRSGETEDTSIAHIAVATGVGYLKAGSLSRTDRIAKYNELIRIEELL